MNYTSDLLNASRFYIPTPMTNAVHEQLQQWLWCGFTGGLIVGEARAGKTKAIKSLSDTLPSRNQQNIALHRVSIAPRDNPKVRSLYANIATSLKLDFSKRATGDELSDSIINYLAEASLSNDQHQVAIVIDEAQLLTLMQLSGFCELYNKLAALEVNLSVFFVANEDQIKPLAEALLAKEQEYIRERFFKQVYRFYGIRDELELRKCLHEYDRKPDNNGELSITESIVPHLYNDGFRLAELSKPMWRLFVKEYKKPLQLTSWRMHYFVSATHVLLLDYLPHYDVHNSATRDDMILRSLEASGLTPSLASLV